MLLVMPPEHEPASWQQIGDGSNDSTSHVPLAEQMPPRTAASKLLPPQNEYRLKNRMKPSAERQLASVS